MTTYTRKVNKTKEDLKMFGQAIVYYTVPLAIMGLLIHFAFFGIAKLYGN